MFLSALDVATTQRWGKSLASAVLQHPLGTGVTTAVVPPWWQCPQQARLVPTPSPHTRLSKRYSCLISCLEQARVNRTSHTSAGVQMKAAWPVESAKYARAAGFAFVFLLFINACIYLLFSPRVGEGGGKGWEPGGRQTGGLVSCLPLLLKA